MSIDLSYRRHQKLVFWVLLICVVLGMAIISTRTASKLDAQHPLSPENETPSEIRILTISSSLPGEETQIRLETTEPETEAPSGTISTPLNVSTSVVHTEVHTTPQPVEPLYLPPFYDVTYPMDVLLHKSWYQTLQKFLSNLSVGSIVYIVSAGEDFLSNLLNWLCTFRYATSSSFVEVLVVAFDDNLHRTLIDKGFNSLFIDNEDIFLPNTKFQSESLSPVWMKRVTVVRIINHLGYHVVMLDLNAIVLKDIVKLFNEYNSSDVIGSIGSDPGNLRKKWGFTVCMGAVFFRNTNRTESLWSAIAKLGQDYQDDQGRVNRVLDILKIKWTQDKECVKHERGLRGISQKCTFEGKTNDGLAITVFSQKVVCRRNCNLQNVNNFYIWHYYNKFQKRAENLTVTWRLTKNWRETFDESEAKGKELIDQISIPERIDLT